MKNKYDIDELLARHFANEQLSDDQKLELETWIKENSKEFQSLSKLIQGMSDTPADIHFDAVRAWDKVESQLAERAERTSFRRRMLYIGSVAASLILLFSLGFYYFYEPEVDAQRYVNAGDTEQLIVLPDSSEVTLSPKASLTFIADASDKCRKVEMQGRAFFSVKKNGTRFQVTTHCLTVEVLGTSFLVDVASSNATPGVFVATGKVRVTALGEETMLVANEKAELMQGKVYKGEIKNPQRLFDTYRHWVQFDNVPVTDITDEVYQQTGVRIELSDGLGKNKVTTRIDMLDIDGLAAELSLLCGCKCDTVIVGKHYRLYE